MTGTNDPTFGSRSLGMSGWQLDGFEELGELGVGGGGRVVLARHETTGRDVAVKYLASWLVDSPDRLADFRTEAELMAGLVDDNLVTLYEYVETDAGAAIAMELVEGVALRAILEEGGPLTPEAALTLMKGSLRGLGALHRQGVVHRDYKPENVMVDATGATKLVDYGIAAPVGEFAGIAGTPLYMAPEQWAGEPSTAASDVYAASATFVESLTGHTVFPATTVDALRSPAPERRPVIGRCAAAGTRDRRSRAGQGPGSTHHRCRGVGAEAGNGRRGCLRPGLGGARAPSPGRPRRLAGVALPARPAQDHPARNGSHRAWESRVLGRSSTP